MPGILGLILALLLALGSLYFGLMNQTPVSVTLLPGAPPRPAYVAEIALYAAMAGALFSAGSLLWVSLGVNQRCRRLGRRVRELEAELQKVRAGGDAGSVSALETGVIPPEIVVPRSRAARVDEEPV